MTGAVFLCAGSVWGLALQAKVQSAPFPVVLSATAAPGGGNYAKFDSPVLNNSGHVAFYATTSGSSYGVFSGMPGSTLIAAARKGASAPQGGVYSSLNDPALNNSGQVAFLAGTSTAPGIFVGTPGSSLVAAARINTPAPSGGNFIQFTTPSFGNSGEVAFVAGTTGNLYGIFAGTAGQTLTTVTLTGLPSPAGGTFSGDVSEPALNSSGQMAFFADAGIFSGTPGQPLTVAAVSGGAAPSGGTYRGDFNVPVFNNSGQVAFVAGVTGATGIFFGTPGSTLTTVAIPGVPSPDGGSFTGDDYSLPSLSNSGKIAFLAATTVSSGGVFTGTPGQPLSAAALTGNPAPAGGDYSTFTSAPVVNAADQVAFLATLSGTGVTSVNNTGLYAGPADDIVKIVRTGDTIDVNPGVGIDLRTVSGINFLAGLFQGRESLNDSGLLVYQLSFTDGSSGIFTSLVPEPASFSLLAAGAGMMLTRRRNRASKEQ